MGMLFVVSTNDICCRFTCAQMYALLFQITHNVLRGRATVGVSVVDLINPNLEVFFINLLDCYF